MKKGYTQFNVSYTDEKGRKIVTVLEGYTAQKVASKLDNKGYVVGYVIPVKGSKNES